MTEITGHCFAIMQDKLNRQLGARVPIVTLYRLEGDDYCGVLGSGATFKWPSSGVLTVEFNMRAHKP